jgi:hypothetical protein
VLLGVRESSPEDPEVKVRLARLEARHDDVTGTVRYYQKRCTVRGAAIKVTLAARSGSR